MFTNPNTSTAFDSVEMGEVDAVLIVPPGESQHVRFVLAYANAETGDRYGKATVHLEMLSAEAKEKWQELCEIVERDWGQRVLDGGSVVRPDDEHVHSAETGQGLKNLGKG